MDAKLSAHLQHICSPSCAQVPSDPRMGGVSGRELLVDEVEAGLLARLILRPPSRVGLRLRYLVYA